MQKTNQTIPLELTDRRQDDVDEFYADVEKAKRELRRVATRDLKTMCKGTWTLVLKNPYSYEIANS